MPPDTVSVVIPTKDGADTLSAVLAAIQEQKTRFEVEVVVVDSGSTDGTLELLRRQPLRLIEIPPGEFDHGETRNLGIRQSRGELVCLLTQDAVPLGPGFLEGLVAPFESPSVAGVYGRQVPRADCDVVRKRDLEGWLTGRREPALLSLDGQGLESLDPMERLRLCTFDNVCSAVRRSVWLEIPFPRAPFGEDIAWGKAVLLAGWSIAYEPGAAVEHSHRRSLGSEYRRERTSHRLLNHLFGLQLVSRRRDCLRATAARLRNDVPYVLRHSPRGLELARQLLRTVGLSMAVPLAQHLGAKEAVRERARSRP